MKVIVDFCLVPIGVGLSLSGYIAQCHKIFESAGIDYQLHAYGTTLEGEWDDVMDALKQCHEVVHAAGAPRIHSNIKIGTRVDRDQGMNDKIRSVEEKFREI